MLNFRHISYFLLLTVFVVSSKSALLNAVYWEVKPFLFTNEDGEIDGIIAKIFENGNMYCNNSTQPLINYTLKHESRNSFKRLLHSNETYTKGKLKNVHREKAVWFPVLGSPKMDDLGIHAGFRRFELIKLSDVVVIVPRYEISLPNKIYRGILSCQQIFIIAFLLSAFFGMVVWMIERFNNHQFSPSFFKGSGSGLWWSLVSMTTVGYGDIVPQSVLGRFVAICWLFIGVLIGCLMTATMTDVVGGVNGLSVHGRTVSVLAHSSEERVAAKDYRANVVPADSYHEVLELVRQQKVFAAIISADVAAWYQDEITDDSSYCPLRIIQKLPAKLYVNSLFTGNVSVFLKSIIKCMYLQRDEVYTQPAEQYRQYCHTETLFIGSVMDLFHESIFIQVLLAIVCGLFLIGVIFEIYLWSGKRKLRRQSCEREEIKLV
ncbi:uncharacterized protein LOC130645313 [Hydractinia symbiolongicarpus]|uniref:uncharacterized protein LOC130645313 n=1 Tax=Hydractinia symbiolongicarpus TaxID=13093 RepID=UPI00254A6D55|nr:uncharacterized protein LOC130645313 [Hydractinia symbiolongicarpus]